MTAEQLQFLFALFSFVGVIGILFYIILGKAKTEEREARIERLEEELISLKDYVYKREEENEEPEVESMKEKIIALYEEGADITLIENALNVPKAKIEMVLKFHNINKSDNWRESVNNTL
ncbi:MAG: Unknown protein [uncultured Sulfurovum sp.]|uniref:Uncharacterized protein n=1 Tax=uncultured Sulfurovum sp. TaxID=269237 RepID=A0A6S6SY98_9BACT|nr:MAG: Unknown protein [uncultured Sulfurovum sp.]